MKKPLLGWLLIWGAGLGVPGWAQKPAEKTKPASSMCECGYICANAKSDARCKVDRCDGKNGKKASLTRRKNKPRKDVAKNPAVSESAAN